MNAHDFLLEADELISPPVVYQRLSEALADPECGVAEVVPVVAADPALTARFLAVANSPAFGLVAHVSTVSHAIAVLGLERTQDLALAASVTSCFRQPEKVTLDLMRFWSSAVARAASAAALANHFGKQQPGRLFDSGRMFTSALLAQVGHLVLALRAPDLLKAVLEQHRETKAPLPLVERERLGFDAAELGAALSENWQLPEVMTVAIRYQHEPWAAPRFAVEAGVLYAAARLQRASEPFPSDREREKLHATDPRFEAIDGIDFDAVRSDARKLAVETQGAFHFDRLRKAG